MWLTTTVWFLLTGVLVVAAAALPLVHDHRFYFVDDTQSGAYGIWYRLGVTLRHGHFPPLLNLQTWQAGNIAAEGQWGLWNPLVLLISVFVSSLDSALIAVTAVKVGLLLLAGTGYFTLLRTYRVPAPWCAVGGVLVTVTGFTGYVDAPSWVTGLITWALVPWFWATLRRVVLRGANPLPALVTGYLVVSVGYLNGTLALIAVLLGVGIGLLIQRRWSSLASLAGIGIFCGLVAVTIYLPGVLTQDITTRSSGKITNDNLLNADLTDLATAAIATAQPTINGFWGPVASSPLLYVTWALPLVTLVDLTRARRGVREVADVLVVGLAASAFAFGPAEMGPLRFPDRMLPFVATCAVMLLVVGLARAAVARPTFGRLLGAVGLLLVSYYLTWGSHPEAGTDYFHAGVAALAGIVAVWAASRALSSAATSRRVSLVAALILVVSLGIDVLQHDRARSSVLADFGAPAHVSEYKDQLRGAQGGVLVVGSQVGSATVSRTDEVWQESLLANLWFLNDHAVMGTYSPVGFESFNTTMCMNWRGESCNGLFTKLFAVQPATGLTLVDELSVSTLQIFRDVASAPALANPPAGWHVLSTGEFTVTWVRDEPRPTAGGVITTTTGARVETVSQSDRQVRLHVDAVPASGGRVTFSRLAWPGYAVTGSGARLGPRMEKYLLSVDLAPAAAGHDVTVTFDPPGWSLEVAATVGAGAAGLVWSLAAAVWALVRRRRRISVPGGRA